MSELVLRRPSPPHSYGRLGLELVLFAALAGLALFHWGELFASPPVGDLLTALAVACAGALALALISRLMPPSRSRRAVAAAVALASLVAALLAVGLPARLLGPENWDELGANLGDGLAGIEDAELPYGGADVWLRLTLLLGVALALSIAGALAFWPGSARGRARALGLTALVSIYAVAVTMNSPGSEKLWGVVLLVLAVAWLWLPDLELPRAAAGALIAVVAGAAALPLAARIETAKPWWDYESWDFFADERSVTFEWNHSYGPLDWPQRGTTLLEVSSDLPLYWKASVLDRFDGFTWQRASPDDVLASGEIAARALGPSAGQLAERNPEWKLRAAFEARGLQSGLVIGTGTPLAIDGAEGALASADGTVLAGDDPIERDDAYAIKTYAPQPSPGRMRAAPQTYPARRFGDAALVGLPAFESDGTSGLAPGPTARIPSWGEPGGPALATVLESEYADVYRLAARLTAGAPTVYDAVRAVERHLQTSYDYSPNVANTTYPLPIFLFADQAGYCQHYAGSMALMLRLVGIPSRVVSGFAPGRYDPDSGTYTVRDTDAHSWVEVYFRGIGWVTFDPTPSAAPAAAQTLESGGPLILRRDGSALTGVRGDLRSIEEALAGGTVPDARADSGGIWGPVRAAGLGLGAIAATVAGFAFAAGRRRLASAEGPELQARELSAALGRLGWSMSKQPTLRGIERRFEAAGRPAIARYAGKLRDHRFADSRVPPPGPGERRRLRRTLASGGGLRRRLRALRAVPPGGPSRGET